MIKLGTQDFHVPPPSGGETFDFQQRIIPVFGRLVGILGALQRVDLKDGWDALKVEDIMTVLPSAMPMLGEVFGQMPPGELGAIRRILLAKATCGKVPLFGSPGGDAFDGLMAGRTMDVWKLMWHALEVWYPDFFGGARALLARRAASEKPSEPSSTSSPDGPVAA